MMKVKGWSYFSYHLYSLVAPARLRDVKNEAGTDGSGNGRG